MKGRSLVRIAAPGRLPLQAPSAHNGPGLDLEYPPATWDYLSADDRTFIDSVISIDDPGGLSGEALSTSLVDQVAAVHTRRTRLKRARIAMALTAALLLGSIGYVAVEAFRIGMHAQARDLALDASGIPESLENLYARTASLAFWAGYASTVPGLLPTVQLAEIQDSLRAALAVGAQSTSLNFHDVRRPVGEERTLVVAREGRAIFRRTIGGQIVLATLDSSRPDSRFSVPVRDDILDWGAAYEGGIGQILVVYPHRLELWRSDKGAASSAWTCEPDTTLTQAVVSGLVVAAVVNTGIIGLAAEQRPCPEVSNKLELKWFRKLESGQVPRLLAVDANGSVAYAVGEQVYAHGKATGNEPLPIPMTAASASFGPSGDSLALLDNQNITVVRLHDASKLRMFALGEAIGVRMAVSPDDAFIAANTPLQLKVWPLSARPDGCLDNLGGEEPADAEVTSTFGPSAFSDSVLLTTRRAQDLDFATADLRLHDFPEMLSFTTLPLSWNPERVLTLGRTAVVEGAPSVQTLILAPRLAAMKAVTGYLPYCEQASGLARFSGSNGVLVQLEGVSERAREGWWRGTAAADPHWTKSVSDTDVVLDEMDRPLDTVVAVEGNVAVIAEGTKVILYDRTHGTQEDLFTTKTSASVLGIGQQGRRVVWGSAGPTGALDLYASWARRDQPFDRDIGVDSGRCVFRVGTAYGALACREFVRVYDLRGDTPQRWTDLHCATHDARCTGTVSRRQVFDVRFDDAETKIAMLVLDGKRFHVATLPLSFYGLESIAVDYHARVQY